MATQHREPDGDEGMGLGGISPRKRMAMGETMTRGDGAGDFGVKAGGSGGVPAVEHMDAGSGTESRHLKDGERGAEAPVMHSRGKMPSQAHPDHGPHKAHKGRGAY